MPHMVPRCLPLSPVSQLRENYLPIKAEFNVWQTLDVNFKQCDLSKVYLKWKLWSHWRYRPSLFFCLMLIYMKFLPFPFLMPIGYRYPFGWLRTVMEKIRTRASSHLPKMASSSLQIKLLVKCLQGWYFTRRAEDHITARKRGCTTSFKSYPYF